MKKFTIFCIIVSVIFLTGFFFRTIPIPVNNFDGVFGGFLMTSGLEQLSFQNYKGSLGFCSIFLIIFSGGYLSKRLWE